MRLMHVLPAALLAVSVAGCRDPITQGRIDDAVARRDAAFQANVGQKRYFHGMPAQVCDDRDMKSCRHVAAGSALVVAVPEVGPSERPLYRVTLETGRSGFMLTPDWNGLATEASVREEAARKAECSRRGGVGIGMTKDQVLQSCWGKPETVNTTHTASGSFEQWVYGSSYVYLRNGVVSSMQTSR